MAQNTNMNNGDGGTSAAGAVGVPSPTLQQNIASLTSSLGTNAWSIMTKDYSLLSHKFVYTVDVEAGAVAFHTIQLKEIPKVKALIENLIGMAMITNFKVEVFFTCPEQTVAACLSPAAMPSATTYGNVLAVTCSDARTQGVGMIDATLLRLQGSEEVTFQVKGTVLTGKEAHLGLYCINSKTVPFTVRVSGNVYMVGTVLMKDQKTLKK